MAIFRWGPPNGGIECQGVWKNQFRGKARYWSKIVIFLTPLVFPKPVNGENIRIVVWVKYFYIACSFAVRQRHTFQFHITMGGLWNCRTGLHRWRLHCSKVTLRWSTCWWSRVRRAVWGCRLCTSQLRKTTSDQRYYCCRIMRILTTR